jgi:hypothetical protein
MYTLILNEMLVCLTLLWPYTLMLNEMLVCFDSVVAVHADVKRKAGVL